MYALCRKLKGEGKRKNNKKKDTSRLLCLPTMCCFEKVEDISARDKHEMFAWFWIIVNIVFVVGVTTTAALDWGTASACCFQLLMYLLVFGLLQVTKAYLLCIAPHWPRMAAISALVGLWGCEVCALDVPAFGVNTPLSVAAIAATTHHFFDVWAFGVRAAPPPPPKPVAVAVPVPSAPPKEQPVPAVPCHVEIAESAVERIVHKVVHVLAASATQDANTAQGTASFASTATVPLLSSNV